MKKKARWSDKRKKAAMKKRILKLVNGSVVNEEVEKKVKGEEDPAVETSSDTVS